MPTILDELVANKKVEIAEMRSAFPLSEARKQANVCAGRFLEVLQQEGTNLITEIKPKSPSGGVLRADLNVKDVLAHFVQYACAISVLTDKKFFDGSFELLNEVAHQTTLPVLCKDIILTDYQCYLARMNGAQAVLLIVKALDDEQLLHLSELITSLGMTPVVEIQNPQEAARALAINARCILINNRDLDTLEIDMTTTLRLAPLVPKDVTLIAASGIIERTQINQYSAVCHNFLIGSSLMLAKCIPEKLSSLKGTFGKKVSG